MSIIYTYLIYKDIELDIELDRELDRELIYS
jgi:hypothetical protein